MEPMESRKKNRFFILMRFIWLGGWQVAFFEEDQHTQIPLQLTFAHADKILEIHERWGAMRTMSERANIEAAIEQSRKGETWINLSVEEYQKLQIAKRNKR
jgi:hypothetical protein